MVKWSFWKRRRPSRMLRLRPRGESNGAVRVDFQKLAPPVETFLGQAAYLQLGYFETLTRLIRATPELPRKEALASAAGAALVKHRGIVEIIRDRGADDVTLMTPFREPLDDFRRLTIGARPEETMLSVHITAGMLDDFYRELAGGYGDTGRRVAKLLATDSEREQLAMLLARIAAEDIEMRGLLSMWARRLVGDTLLVARGALVMDAPADADGVAPTRGEQEAVVEPVFTALLAAHARRMDAVGLAS